MASYRHLARTVVMQTVFTLEFKDQKDTPEKILDNMLNEFAPKLTEKEFAQKTLNGVIDNRKKIDKIIEKYAPEWPLDKIAKVDRAILEIGVYEIAFSDGEVPPVVAINEAVEIAKHFGDENSPRFINGVLSTVMKKYHEK